jgi:hypothetical protein
LILLTTSAMGELLLLGRLGADEEEEGEDSVRWREEGNGQR